MFRLGHCRRWFRVCVRCLQAGHRGGLSIDTMPSGIAFVFVREGRGSDYVVGPDTGSKTHLRAALHPLG